MPFKASKLLSELYKQAQSSAKKQGVAELNIKLLLSDITNISVPALMLERDKYLTSEQVDFFNHSMQRLLKREPIQYILQKTNFYGLELMVNENVLIPRPETEGLVEWIIQREKEALVILDIGTGSGAIALALKHLNPAYRITATDVSHEAIRIARHNAVNLGLKVNFNRADLFPPMPLKFDVIVSNPPYITTAEYYTLDTEIQYYEPKLALHAGRDGLILYRRILADACKHLNPSGKIYLEIGESQAKAIIELADRQAYKKYELKQDLAGKDRYLCFSK